MVPNLYQFGFDDYRYIRLKYVDIGHSLKYLVVCQFSRDDRCRLAYKVAVNNIMCIAHQCCTSFVVDHRISTFG